MRNSAVEAIPSLVIKKIIRAKREKVFEAFTDPRLLQKWLIGRAGWSGKSTMDFRVGGSFRQEMIVGPVGDSACSGELPEGTVLPYYGEYLEILPPEKLVFTWNSPSVQNTRVTVELTDRGDTTELWLTHELLETEALRTSHTGGWNVCLENLDQLFSN